MYIYMTRVASVARVCDMLYWLLADMLTCFTSC